MRTFAIILGCFLGALLAITVPFLLTIALLP